MGNERGGHDQRSGQDHHQEHPLVETVKHQPGVLRFNGKEEEDGDQPARGNVQKGRQRLLLHDGQQHEPNDVKKDTDDQPLHQHFEIKQHPQADGHSKQHKEEGSNYKGALQRQDVEVVVEGLHALVLEQLSRPAVGDAQPIRKEELVVVEHQPKNQNEDERAQVEELLDGVDEQQDGNAQKQTDTALDLLQDVHHEVGDHHRDDQRTKQVEGHVGQDFTSGSGLLIAQEEIKGHDAEDVRKRALVDHEFPRSGRQPSDAGDDDGAAHDGQRDGVHHGVQPRHGNGVVKEGGDGAGAQGQCGQRECRAAQDEGEFVAPEFEF